MLAYNLKTRLPALDLETRRVKDGPYALLDLYSSFFDLLLDYATDFDARNQETILDVLTSEIVPLYWEAATDADDPVLRMVGWRGIRKFYWRSTLPESASTKLFKGRKWDALASAIMTTYEGDDADVAFQHECAQVAALSVVAAVVFQTHKCDATLTRSDHEISGPSKRLVKAGCVDMLMDIVSGSSQPRSVVALAAEVLDTLQGCASVECKCWCSNATPLRMAMSAQSCQPSIAMSPRLSALCFLF
jgi:hypothetical protein